MTQMLIDNDGTFIFDSMDAEETLEPADRRCDCCGRDRTQLKPFGKAGDPIKKDFSGKYFVKTLRLEGTFNKEALKAMIEFKEQDSRDLYAWLLTKYSKKKSYKLYHDIMAYAWCNNNWQCRDCVVLSNDEYFEKSGRENMGQNYSSSAFDN